MSLYIEKSLPLPGKFEYSHILLLSNSTLGFNFLELFSLKCVYQDKNALGSSVCNRNQSITAQMPIIEKNKIK